MRSARMLLATATATAALAIAAPTAYAETMGDRDHDTTSYSKEHDKDGKHHKPRGGVHTGGGALTAVTADDDSDRSEYGKDAFGDKHDKGDDHGKHDDHGKDFGHGKHDKHDKHDKPRGGVHTGGGALTAVNADDDWDNPKHDPDSLKDGERGDDTWNDKHDEDAYGDKHDENGKHDEHGKGDDHGKHDDHGKDFGHGKHDEHDKPRGGMHTGGGGLAGSPGVTAGGLAMLAVAGTGLYALRRQKASQGA
ncbi:hypothetical protein [Streptomyces lomondensis]|uniref:Uncharacterized protein n=1 Tax=Streptomyces lomondensis TaxID=68229 RepID=A0ABQ2X7B2_9ACTN|nr:hypothetical protein [Streptomyces lomondensis]MCF0081525.1 hypothetical protein [Streptomyces lomondensis]GGX02306.1 hypothetical protein GCM10010383_35690 [Streptomyces lomondensis]